jgi:hypothetical protein
MPPACLLPARLLACLPACLSVCCHPASLFACLLAFLSAFFWWRLRLCAPTTCHLCPHPFPPNCAHAHIPRTQWPGFTAAMKAARRLGNAASIATLYHAAVAAKCGDERLCHTALSALLQLNDSAGAARVADDMAARGVEPTSGTARLLQRVAEGREGADGPVAATAAAAAAAAAGSTVGALQPHRVG